MEELATKRLLLRAWQPADAPFLLDLESREETIRYLGPGVRPMETIEAALASIRRRRKISGPGQGIWLVVRKDTGKPIGNLLCKPANETVTSTLGFASGQCPTEIGWHFHPEGQGAGYALEAAHALVEHALQAGLSPIVAIVDQRNVASQKLCQRLGLELTGTTHGYENPEHLVYQPESIKAVRRPHR